MNSLKRIATAALSAALCFSMAVPAYADHYQTPKSIKGVLINEHAPDSGRSRGRCFSGRFKLSDVLDIQQPVICLPGSLHKA